MTNYASVTFALVLGVALAGSTAHAQLLDSSGSASINLNGSTSTQTGISTDATTTVEVGASMGSEEAADASVLEFRFNGNSMPEDTTYGVTESGQVRSSASLESYAASSVRDNDRVESIELSDGQMQMRYKQDAKFLWVIPASMTTTITVDANGNVSVSYPWYSFLMSAEESADELSTRLESRIESVVAADVNGDGIAAETSATADSSAEIRYWARAMDRVMDSLSVDATANGEVQI